jgi:putative oxidoreductase
MSALTQRLRISLLLLRLSIVIVLLAWTMDKQFRPEHGAGVLEHFYGMAGLGAASIHALAVAELILITLFALGLFKTWTYGAVLLLHAATTLVSYQQYLHPFDGPNLLFFAAWPMLAACLALFLLRDEDRLASLGSHAT